MMQDGVFNANITQESDPFRCESQFYFASSVSGVTISKRFSNLRATNAYRL